jgi:hypothetical protein
MLKIELAKRYITAFGFNQLGKAVESQLGISANDLYKFASFEKGDPEFENVTFKWETNFLKFGVEKLRAYNPESVISSDIYAPPPIITFSREKDLTITKLNGDGIEVIERWSSDAWDIKMSGLLIDSVNRQYPTEKIEELTRFFEYNNIIEVSGTQFYEKNIDFIYIKGIEFSPLIGFEDTMQFSLSGRSIKDLGFKLNE